MASLKDRQQKTVTASGKPAFHPPGCSRQDDALMEVSRAHARAADFFPVVTLQGKSSRECRFYQKCQASVGWRHVRPACFAVPAGYCQRRISPHSLQAHGRRPRVQILPRSQKGKALTMDVVRAFFCTLLFSVLRQSPVLCHSLQAPAPSTTAASARSASGYRSLRPFYSQGRPRWADPSRNRNVPLIP